MKRKFQFNIFEVKGFLKKRFELEAQSPLSPGKGERGGNANH